MSIHASMKHLVCVSILFFSGVMAQASESDFGGFEDQILDYEWSALSKIDDLNQQIAKCGSNEDCQITNYEKIYLAYTNIIISRISQRDDKASASAMFRQFDSTRMLFVRMKRACDRNYWAFSLRDNACYIETMSEIQATLHEMFVSELRHVATSVTNN